MKCSKPLQNHDQGLFTRGHDLSEKRENEICYETIHFGANIFRAFNGQLISAQKLPSTAPPPPRAPPHLHVINKLVLWKRHAWTQLNSRHWRNKRREKQFFRSSRHLILSASFKCFSGAIHAHKVPWCNPLYCEYRIFVFWEVKNMGCRCGLKLRQSNAFVHDISYYAITVIIFIWHVCITCINKWRWWWR